MQLIPRRTNGGRRTSVTPFDDLFDRFNSLVRMPTFEHLPETFTRTAFPELETYETEDAFHVDVDLPGLDREDVNVELVGNQLRIHGERKWEKTRKKHREGGVEQTEEGRFDFMVTVPNEVRFDADEIKAKLEKGVLQIEIPKFEPTPAKRIAVD